MRPDTQAFADERFGLHTHPAFCSLFKKTLLQASTLLAGPPARVLLAFQVLSQGQTWETGET